MGDLRRIVHLKSGWSPKFLGNRDFDFNLIFYIKKEFKKHIIFSNIYKMKDKINLKLRLKDNLNFYIYI